VSLSVPERIAQVAEHFAEHDAHGYSQPNRGTGRIEEISLSDGSAATISGSDVDCSEMVRQCVNCALSGRLSSPIVYMWTGNEHAQLTSHGFERLPYSEAAVRRGDVLFVRGHTGVALGNGLQADAHGDEGGGLSGHTGGDNTGHEVEVRSLRPWTYIYRWEEPELTEADVERIVRKVVREELDNIPFRVWAYRNKAVEGVDVYQILRDIRTKLGIRDGQR